MKLGKPLGWELQEEVRESILQKYCYQITDNINISIRDRVYWLLHDYLNGNNIPYFLKEEFKK